MSKADNQKLTAIALVSKELTVHPIADLFPMMSDEELADLAASIRANGRRFPIVVDGDMLIDGRNRLAACELAGVEPTFEELGDRDPVAFIADVNLSRRNLTKAQHAMGYAFLYPEGVKGKKDVRKPDNFSRQRLSEARLVLRFSPELAKTVFDGLVPLDQALKTIDEQQLQAAGNAARLDRLRKGAPDLAELVAEERMSLNEATAAFEVRETRRRHTYEHGVKVAKRLPYDLTTYWTAIFGADEARTDEEPPIVIAPETLTQLEDLALSLRKREEE